jgi:hypothetical protein
MARFSLAPRAAEVEEAGSRVKSAEMRLLRYSTPPSNASAESNADYDRPDVETDLEAAPTVGPLTTRAHWCYLSGFGWLALVVSGDAESRRDSGADVRRLWRDERSRGLCDRML